MTSTIGVPISLIKAGDMDAIRELLPKPESLFGRWATHPKYGRGIIISACPTVGGRVRFAYKNEDGLSDIDWDFVPPAHLTLDPVELVTAEDFKDAPEGTVVADPTGNAYQKVYADYWKSYDDGLSNEWMAAKGPWTILRWGWGEQQ